MKDNAHQSSSSSIQSVPDSTLSKSKKKRKRNRKKKKRRASQQEETSSATTTSITEVSCNEDTASRSPAAAARENGVLPPQKRQRIKAFQDIDVVSTRKRPTYKFNVDEADHCETPLQAYRDIVPLLDKICKTLKKTRSNLVIYDPYYCNGGIKSKLASLGFTNVINENRDFYQDISSESIPHYNVLITNPPYSGQHMEKLLKFVAHHHHHHSEKPHFLLLPHFVYTKDYYKNTVPSNHFFFLVPSRRYNYEPPMWTLKETAGGSTAMAKGKRQTAPFMSFWYCCCSVKEEWLTQTFGKSGVYSPQKATLQYANCTAHLPRHAKGELDPSKKRPNPRARKRAAKKKLQKKAAGGF